MQVHDFFQDQPGPVPAFGIPQVLLRNDLVVALREGPPTGEDDLSCAIPLTRLVHEELEVFGTGGTPRITSDQLELCQRTLRSLLGRLQINFNPPWRNFSTFKSHWINNGCANSHKARRNLLDAFFGPIHEALDRLEEQQFRAVLADPVSPVSSTGWPRVDEEVRELKQRFRTATTPQDYRDVGNRCVATLEALSATVYDAARHLRSGEDVPPVDKTKQRLERYVEESLAGKENEAIRGVATKVIVLAHAVKHSTAPSRREAGIAADAVILLVNVLRRVDEPF